MKAILSLLAVPFLLAATASADLIVELKIESPMMNTNTTMKMKGDKMRADVDGGPTGQMSTITDAKTGDVVTLMHAQKMAMKISAAQMKQSLDQLKAAGGLKDGAAAVAPKATGEKEKVGDYDCEIYTWSDGNTSAKFWVAKNHPKADALKAFSKQMRNAVPGAKMGPDESELPGPAVKSEVTSQGQKITSTLVSVKEQDLDAKDFEVPADYKSMALPSGLGGGK
jgi:hypothetical protein